MARVTSLRMLSTKARVSGSVSVRPVGKKTVFLGRGVFVSEKSRVYVGPTQRGSHQARHLALQAIGRTSRRSTPRREKLQRGRERRGMRVSTAPFSIRRKPRVAPQRRNRRNTHTASVIASRRISNPTPRRSVWIKEGSPRNKNQTFLPRSKKARMSKHQRITKETREGLAWSSVFMESI